jgi:putative two-component system response regulator
MQKTIFVVDDSATSLSMAEEALEKHYRVITLSSAEKMFTILDKVKPDLILLDIDMPEQDGFEAMKRLRDNALWDDIPVIFLTGMTDVANETHAIELGALDFITKPISEPLLLNRIRNYMDIEEKVRERTRVLLEKIEWLTHYAPV